MHNVTPFRRSLHHDESLRMQIRIEFLSNVAPETVAAVHALAGSRTALFKAANSTGTMRAPPQGSVGPPYGLLQVPMASKEGCFGC